MSNLPIFKIYRETSLPSRLEAYAIYLIAPPDKQDYFEMYVTDATGSKAKRMWGEREVKEFVAQSLASTGQLSIAENIAARDRLSSPKQGTEVFVIDASADPTVNRGGARYIYNNRSWLKISETEAMDLRLSWDTLEGKPNSSVTDIDDAVSKRHSHTNKTQLDKIGEQNGQMTYGGEPIKTSWGTVNW